jgi:hypothetical protein
VATEYNLGACRQTVAEFDRDTMIQAYWLATIRAAIPIDRGDAQILKQTKSEYAKLKWQGKPFLVACCCNRCCNHNSRQC